MLLRKARKASNTWYRLGRPKITSGEMAGQRDQERIVVSIQIVPEDSFDEYGDRKVTGFTLKEIAEMVETGTGKTILSNPEDQMEGLVLAQISIGDGMDQVTLTELRQILDAMGGTVLSTPSPLDTKDRERLRAEKDPEPKVIVVQGQVGPPPVPQEEAKDADQTSPEPDEPATTRPTRRKNVGTRTSAE